MTTNVPISPDDGWTELTDAPEATFTLTNGGQHCIHTNQPDDSLIGHRFRRKPVHVTTESGESVWIKVSRVCNAVLSILRQQYEFDGIDDYVLLPTIEVLAGDVVEFDFIGIDNSDSVNKYMFDTTVGTRCVLNFPSSGITTSLSLGDVYIDGVISTTHPQDNDSHTCSVVVTANSFINVLAINSTLSIFSKNSIKNFGITRANPTTTHPDLYWPMNDGWDNNPTIRETLVGDGTWDGTAINFNEEQWSYE